MHGDTRRQQPDAPADLALEESAVRCPVHRVEITPCDPAELAPLLEHLRADLAVERRFPRGTLTEDGRLDLCKQSLGTGNCLQLAEALRHTSHVRSLMLGTDAIGDAGAEAVAQLAAHNPALEVLYLGCNNIGPAGACALSATLADAPHNLTGLWLKRNPLGPEGAASLAAMLRRNRQLRVLDLVNTDLRATGVRAVVEALCSGNTGLQALYLSGNGLEPASAADLVRLLREATHVRALYLSANRLGDEGALALAEGLRGNHSLHTLELASNGIGPAGAEALFSAAQTSSLQTLNLGYAPSTRVLGSQANCIGDAGASHAADFVAASASLGRLDLTRNGITPDGIALLVDAARRSRQLGELHIGGSLPSDLIEKMAHLRAAWDDAVFADQNMIKSVYR